MRSIYLAANPQSPNPIFDVFEPPKQTISSKLQQVASGIWPLFDHAHQQIRRWPDSGLAFSAPAFLAPSAMFNLAKDMQNRRRIRQMIVYQQQGQLRQG
jgi:hypothetical protein